MGVGDFFQDGGSGIASLWIGDVGDDPPNGPCPVGFSTQGGQEDHRETVQADYGRKLVVPPLGVSDMGGRVGGGGGIHIDESYI